MCRQNKHHFVDLWARSWTIERFLAPLGLSTEGTKAKSVVWHTVFHCSYPRECQQRSSGLVSRNIFLRLELVKTCELSRHGLPFLFIRELHLRNKRMMVLVHINIGNERTDFRNFHARMIPRESDTSESTAIGCETTTELELEGSAITLVPGNRGVVQSTDPTQMMSHLKATFSFREVVL